MEQLILDFLGPAAAIPMVIVALLVWRRRHAVRKGHLLALVALTAIGLVGFFAALLAAWGRSLPESLVMPLLHATAWLTVGAAAGFTVAFWVLWLRRFEKTDA
ncbi:MAG: hypothetical protein K2Y31_02765 [Burkholderiales bacterium]|jgi:uncharacterized membrane protein|nr:hypothetical protein [Burkholderiales bacterium]